MVDQALTVRSGTSPPPQLSTYRATHLAQYALPSEAMVHGLGNFAKPDVGAFCKDHSQFLPISCAPHTIQVGGFPGTI